MPQSSGSGPDLHLPDEILKVIPTDPYDQLDLARKITSMAIASRVSKMDLEIIRTRQTLKEKDRLILELEQKVMGINHACQEAESKLKNALDDNTRLSKERDNLALTVKKLTRDLEKLETFKKQLVRSLSDDYSTKVPFSPVMNYFSQPAEAIDIGTCEQSIPKAYPSNEDEANGYTAYLSNSGSSNVGNKKADEDPRLSRRQSSMTLYNTPGITPTGTPSMASTAVSPRVSSAIPTPQKSSGTASPTKLSFDGQSSHSSWNLSSQQSSASVSPQRTRSLPGNKPRIDGKEFFRQARSRLSYEQFSAFLTNVKELNAQKQTREETLSKAEEIFGTDNRDLYLSFQGLLSRSIY